MYSSEYTSSFSGPCAAHLAAPPSPRHEGNVGQAPRTSRETGGTGETDEGWLVHLVWLAHLNKRDRPDKQERPAILALHAPILG
jgi:hypothetical protein